MKTNTRTIAIAASVALLTLALGSCSDRTGGQGTSSGDAHGDQGAVVETGSATPTAGPGASEGTGTGSAARAGAGIALGAGLTGLLANYDHVRPVGGGDLAFVAKDGKFALARVSDGELVAGLEHEGTGRSMDDRYVMVKDGQFGLLDGKGETLVPFQYDAIRIADKDRAFFKKDGKWGLVGLKGHPQRLLDPEYDEVALVAPGLLALRKGDKWAVVDDSGLSKPDKMEFEYDDMPGIGRYESAVARGDDVEGLSGPKVRVPVVKNGFQGYVDDQGREVVPFNYVRVGDFDSDGFAMVSKSEPTGEGEEGDSGWMGPIGWIDSSGNEIAPVSDGVNYERVGDLFMGRGPDGRIAIRTLQGEAVDLSEYDDIGHYGEGLIPVRRNGLWGFIDTGGDEKIKPAWSEVSGFCHNRAVVVDQNLYGLLDKEGAYVIPPQYEMIRSPGIPTDPGEEEAFAVVKRDGKWGVLDAKTGDIVVDAKYDDVRFDPSGVIFVKLDGKTAVLDSTGAEKSPAMYDEIVREGDFFRARTKNEDGKVEEDLLAVSDLSKLNKEPHEDYRIDAVDWIWAKTDGKWGVIDQEGETVIEPRYEEVEPNVTGLTPAKWNGKWGLVNYKGEEILAPTYEDMRVGIPPSYPAMQGGKWGLVDQGGMKLTDFSYEDVRIWDDSHYVMKRGGKWGVSNAFGSPLLETEYDWNDSPEGALFKKGDEAIPLARWMLSN